MNEPLEASKNMVWILWDGDDSPSLVPLADLELIEKAPAMTTSAKQTEIVDEKLLGDTLVTW